jgi:acyl carrier protein
MKRMDDAILDRVREETANCLGLRKDEVHADSMLVKGLGAESLDLVDLTFRLEKAFDIVIPGGTLFEDPSRKVETLTITDVALHVTARRNAPAA